MLSQQVNFFLQVLWVTCWRVSEQEHGWLGLAAPTARLGFCWWLRFDQRPGPIASGGLVDVVESGPGDSLQACATPMMIDDRGAALVGPLSTSNNLHRGSLARDPRPCLISCSVCMYLRVPSDLQPGPRYSMYSYVPMYVRLQPAPNHGRQRGHMGRPERSRIDRITAIFWPPTGQQESGGDAADPIRSEEHTTAPLCTRRHPFARRRQHLLVCNKVCTYLEVCIRQGSRRSLAGPMLSGVHWAAICKPSRQRPPFTLRCAT